jgi:LacI family transcriptional regulator
VATITDVARRAGVSVSTVSHVVNGTRKVRHETASLVREAIEATGFRPNGLARSLKRASSESVGIVMSVISNPYFADIVCAIESECARLGLMVFLCDSQDDPEQELKVVEALHRRRVDGVILAPSPDRRRRAAAYLESNGIPFVVVDRLAGGGVDQVGVRNKSAMQQLVAHLISHGHRRIGFVAGQNGFSTARERAEGYRAALRAAGVPFDGRLFVAGAANTRDAASSVRRFFELEEPPTALATGNNMTTIGAMHALRDLGLRAPQDVALAGFDDFEWADYFEPRLTVVAQPCEEIGREAASLLIERIKRNDGPRRTIRLNARLVIRASCGCQAASHPMRVAPSHAAAEAIVLQSPRRRAG